MPKVPTFERLEPKLLPLVAGMWRTKNGVVYERQQTLPLGGNEVVAAPIMLSMFVPVVGSARMAAQTTTSMNNMKQIALAMHNYHSAYNHFPSEAICDKEGKPLLSWRVAILPFVDQNDLYLQFHLDEPWDTAHNKPLAEKMPVLYAKPGARRPATRPCTSCRSARTRCSPPRRRK